MPFGICSATEKFRKEQIAPKICPKQQTCLRSKALCVRFVTFANSYPRSQPSPSHFVNLNEKMLNGTTMKISKKALKKVKNFFNITSLPVLYCYSVSKDVTFRCDASQSEIGVALLQKESQ